jgi:GcrA cell cycle regulator
MTKFRSEAFEPRLRKPAGLSLSTRRAVAGEAEEGATWVSRSGSPLGNFAMPAASCWTDDRVQTLTRLWRDGLSASQIARTLAGGLTRNAVIGKVHRLGLSGRAAPSPPVPRVQRETRSRRGVERRAPAPSRSAPTRVPTPPPPSVGAATILTVRRGQCRWPIGDPRDGGFSLCGCSSVRGAYCAGHAELAYRPLARKPPRDHLLKLAGLA